MISDYCVPGVGFLILSINRIVFRPERVRRGSIGFAYTERRAAVGQRR